MRIERQTGAGGVSTGGDTVSRIQEMQAKLDELLLRYTDRHPDVIAARAALADLKQRRINEMESLRRGDASAVAKPVQHVSRVQTGGIPLWAIIACGVVFVFLLIHCAVSGGVLCQIMTQMAFMAATSSGRGGSGGSGPSFGGGGGSFGGGGSSGKW